ncbi:hypothetical protein ACTXT7_012057 [Hymenolepis weldensis]
MSEGKGTSINGPLSEVESTPVNNAAEIDRTAADRGIQRTRRNRSDPTEPILSLFVSNDLPEPERNAILWNPCDPVSSEGRCGRSMFTSEPPPDSDSPKNFENFYEGVSSAVPVHKKLRWKTLKQ